VFAQNQRANFAITYSDMVMSELVQITINENPKSKILSERDYVRRHYRCQFATQ